MGRDGSDGMAPRKKGKTIIQDLTQLSSTRRLLFKRLADKVVSLDETKNIIAAQLGSVYMVYVLGIAQFKSAFFKTGLDLDRPRTGRWEAYQAADGAEE